MSGHAVGNGFQHSVSRGNAEGVVVELEIDDVGAENTVLPAGIPVQNLLGLLKEEFLAVQPGEPVVLEVIDHRRSLPQMDDARDTVENHLGPVGLGNKVRSAVGESQNLGILAVGLGQDDHRDQGEPGILLDGVQKGVAVHDRHHNVQQNQGNALRVLPEQFQRGSTVFRFQRGIPRGQNFHQHGPVQRVVLNYQYFLPCFHDISPRQYPP